MKCLKVDSCMGNRKENSGMPSSDVLRDNIEDTVWSILLETCKILVKLNHNH